MLSIHDVARKAGVSKSTVSRFLNHPESVKESTRAAVEQAIEELEYSPSYFAQGIRTGRTKTIAMVIPEYSNIFYTEMFRGVEDVALRYGYMVMLCNTERHSTTEVEYTAELLKRNIDGIIYCTYRNSKEMLAFLKKTSDTLPVVFMDKIFDDESDVSYVITDGFESTRKAVRYLYSRGKRKIGYIRTSVAVSVTGVRFEGYLKGLEDCKVEPNPDWVYRTRLTDEPDYYGLGSEAGLYFANCQEKPDAILATTDMLAIGCIRALKNEGIRVPEDISIIGFDNISLSAIYDPPLTTISQPTRLLGQTAAGIIIGKLNGEKRDDKVVFDGDLIIRGSTN